MLQIDDNLLKDLGLGDLPEDERKRLLAQIYETLELRVGMKLAEKMSEDQLDEFERFIDGDISYARQYLDELNPGWDENEAFKKQLEQALQAGASENAVIAEFAALRWLETNFPNYKQVVASELEKLKTEISSDAQQIKEAV